MCCPLLAAQGNAAVVNLHDIHDHNPALICPDAAVCLFVCCQHDASLSQPSDYRSVTQECVTILCKVLVEEGELGEVIGLFFFIISLSNHWCLSQPDSVRLSYHWP